MADYAHELTDKQLEELEKRVAEVYRQASEEMKQKLEKWYKDFERLDKQKAALVEAGKLEKAEYLAWRKGKMADSGRLKALVDTLTKDFVNSDKIAMQIVRGDLTDVYALNANYAAYKIEQNAGVDLSLTLYDHSTVERMIREEPDVLPLPSVNIPVDEQWNRKHLNNAITQGILQGGSIPHIADRLQRIIGMDRTAAVRSARTAITAAECAGRQDTYQRAKGMGIQLKKQWLATLDGKTRHAHRMLDGQTVDVEESFQVDGYKLKCPGDPSAPGYLIYNCRCTMISVDKFHDPNAPRASKLGDLSYEDWKAGKDLQLQKVQKEEEKQRKAQLKNEENRAILKEKIDSGEIPLKVNKGQQRKHIEGTNEYTTYANQRKSKGKDPQSILTINEADADMLIKKYAATGYVSISNGKDGNIKIREYVQTDKIIGKWFGNGTYTDTRRAAIHYSKRGGHIVPISEDYNG